MSDREDRRRKRLEDVGGRRDRFVPTPTPIKQPCVPALDSHAIRLFDLLIEAPQTPEDDVVYGVTWPEACQVLGIGKERFQQVLQHLRKMYGFDQGAIVCDPPTPQRVAATGNREYPYVITQDPDEARSWLNRRLVSIVAQAETLQAVVESIVRHVDGRTSEGRALLKLDRYLNRWLEDVEDEKLLDG